MQQWNLLLESLKHSNLHGNALLMCAARNYDWSNLRVTASGWQIPELSPHPTPKSLEFLTVMSVHHCYKQPPHRGCLKVKGYLKCRQRHCLSGDIDIFLLCTIDNPVPSQAPTETPLSFINSSDIWHKELWQKAKDFSPWATNN